MSAMDASNYFCDKCEYVKEACICKAIVKPKVKKEHSIEWSECCNEPALYSYIDGELEIWDFCRGCLDCTSYYEADKPREVKDEEHD